MQIATLVRVLDQPQIAADHLHAWGLRDTLQGQRTLLELADSGLTLELLAGLCSQLGGHLPRTGDPDAALEAFRRYFFAVRSPLALAAMMERDPSAMPMLLGAMSLGPRWAALLVDDPEAFDLLRQTEGKPLARDVLLGDVLAEVSAFSDERLVTAALGRIRERHRLRIAYGEVVGGLDATVAMEQLSLLAEAIIEATLGYAQRKASEARTPPPPMAGGDARCTVLAVGKLGAGEMEYGAPLELMVIYDAATENAAAFRAVHEHFERVARLLVKCLGETYKLRLIPLPDSSVTASAHAAEDVVVGFDSFGRTWHRQAMLKARPVAGDRELGSAILARLEAWLYRRYLNEPDETGIKALKRRIMTEATLHQDDWRDVRLGRGALRDLEATIEFLQLLTGGDQAAARQRGTLAAMEGMELTGAISADERRLLENGYLYLRRLLHRLQILIEPAASEIPEGGPLAQRIAASLARKGSADDLAAELQRRTTAIWETLRKLLDSAFAQEPSVAREVELLLDPSPAAEEVRAALAPFGFAEPITALGALNDLAAEQVSFLSTRRCRHLLASILPRLLSKIGATPDPDRTLDNLARVSNSLGGKAVLWDLIRASPPSLELYVRLCAASPYLSGILTTNPGMIDELVDSLQLDKLASRSELEAMLDDLCRGASDTLPILHDFKNANILRIGVREILGKDDIDATHQALTDVAEICLTHVAELEYGQLTEKFGVPTIGAGPREGDVCRLVIGGLRELGARDLNYHSRLDVVFLYEADGATRRASRGRQEQTANHHFFTQFAQRVIKQLGQLTPKGRLYTTDALLRPIGVAGALVLSMAEFTQHFAGGAAPFWHWQAMCEARWVYGEGSAREYVEQATGRLIVERPWKDADLSDIRRSRLELQQAASPVDVKRGPGGTQDVELVVRMLQLRHAAERPPLLVRSPQDALVVLSESGIVQREVGRSLAESYRFLCRVQSGLALMNVTAHHEPPADPQALGQLALLLGHSNPQRLREQCAAHMAENCASLDTLLNALV